MLCVSGRMEASIYWDSYSVTDLENENREEDDIREK